MERTKMKAIMAFYNVFSEELGIEDSTTLRELRQMIPIIVDFIKNGNLKFASNPEFGFSSAVEFMRQGGIDEGLYTHLDPVAAEAQNALEMAKIFVALMYELRLVQTDAFTSYCDKLTKDENAEIGEIIRYMDDRQSWPLAPWPTVLNSSTMFHDSTANKENETELPQSSQASGSSSFNSTTPDYRPAKAALPARARSAMVVSRTLGLSAPHQQFFNAQKPIDFDEYDTCKSQSPTTAMDSPVAKVVYSPRGEEVTRMRQLKRENAELKKQVRQFGRERDFFEDRCADQKKTIAGLTNHVKSLKDRINGLRAETERMSEIDTELVELQATESALQTELQQTKNALNEAVADRKHMTLQKASAEQRYGLKQAELERVKADYETVVRRERETDETLRKIHEELLAEQLSRANEAANFQQKIRRLEELLEDREKSWKCRLEEKDQQLFDHIQLMNDVQLDRGLRAETERMFEIDTELVELHAAESEQRYGLKQAELEQVKPDYETVVRRECETDETLRKIPENLTTMPSKSNVRKRQKPDFTAPEPWLKAEPEDVAMYSKDLDSKGFAMTICISPI